MIFGLTIGIWIAVFAVHYHHYLYLTILKNKGKREGRTPEKILDRYYFIIPEDEYFELKYPPKEKK